MPGGILYLACLSLFPWVRTEDDERSTFWGLSCSICLDGADSKVDGFHLFSEDNFFGSNAAFEKGPELKTGAAPWKFKKSSSILFLLALLMATIPICMGGTVASLITLSQVGLGEGASFSMDSLGGHSTRLGLKISLSKTSLGS